MSVTAGSGDDTITELSLAVSRDESIYAGSGDDSLTIGGATVAASGVTIGRGLTSRLVAATTPQRGVHKRHTQRIDQSRLGRRHHHARHPYDNA